MRQYFNALGKIIKRHEVIIAYGLAHIGLFILPFLELSKNAEYGIGYLERQVASFILHGYVPYSGFLVEYPPLALLSFLLPGLFSLDLTAYINAYAFEMLIFDLIIIVLLVKLARHLKLSVNRTLLFYTLVVIAVGPIIIARYDILPAMLVLLALYALVRGKSAVAWSALALGVLAKLYPIIIVPLFALFQLRNRDYLPLRNGLIAFFAVMAIFTLPWLFIDAGGFLYTLTYHAERGLHSESTYGTALLLAQLQGLTSVTGELSFGSWNLKSALADNLAHLSNYILGTLLLGTYFTFAMLLWRKSRNGQDFLQRNGFSLLVGFTTLTVVVFLVANKVFSIQYVVWLSPLVPLLSGVTRRSYFVWIFIVICALTQYIYPYNYMAFESGAAYAVIIMALRNLLLIFFGALIILPYLHPVVMKAQPRLVYSGDPPHLRS